LFVTCDKLVLTSLSLCSSRVTNSFQLVQACVCYVWRTFFWMCFFLFVTCDELVCFLSCLCLSRVTKLFATCQICVRHMWRTRLQPVAPRGRGPSKGDVNVFKSFFLTADYFSRVCFSCSSRVTNSFATCQACVCYRDELFFGRCFFLLVTCDEFISTSLSLCSSRVTNFF